MKLGLAAIALTAACGVTDKQIDVKPPRAPRAFATSIDAIDDPPQPAGSAAPLTDSAVWWSAFADPVLDAAIQEGFHNNNAIRDVRGLIYENQLDPATPQGWWWPLQVGILTPAGLQHVSAPVTPQPGSVVFDIANLDLSATYQIDLWGNLAELRRTGMNVAEQQRLLTEQSVQDLAVKIAQAWFDILETRALRTLTIDQIKYNQELFELVKARFDQHLTPRLVVLQQQQLLLNLQSQVPLIDARIALLNSQLHGFLGRMPSPADDIVPVERQLPDLPPAPGLGTPSELNESTPELRLAQLRLAEIQHRINVNRSSWLPTLQLVGSIGVSEVEQTLGKWTQLGRDETVGVTLTWIMFDGQRYTDAKRLPIQLRRREFQYQLAMQTAVGRVQDAVIREDNQATSLESLRAQVELGRQVLDEARRLFEQGQSDYLPVLTALNNQVELERAALQAQRLLLNDRVELYRSLGGNWSYDVTKLRD